MKEKYKEEVINRWGGTKEYMEYSKKNIKGDELNHLIMEIFKEFGSLKHLSPSNEIVQNKVKEWHEFINKNLYNCSKNVLKSLSEMYVCDERFKNNIDFYGGNGTAMFVKEAITYYTK